MKPNLPINNTLKYYITQLQNNTINPIEIIDKIFNSNEILNELLESGIKGDFSNIINKLCEISYNYDKNNIEKAINYFLSNLIKYNNQANKFISQNGNKNYNLHEIIDNTINTLCYHVDRETNPTLKKI